MYILKTPFDPTIFANVLRKITELDEVCLHEVPVQGAVLSPPARAWTEEQIQLLVEDIAGRPASAHHSAIRVFPVG